MKKVRVLKEMPFAKVGEELELEEDKPICESKLSKFGFYVYHLVAHGWCEYIEEPKSLEEKFTDKFKSDQFFVMSNEMRARCFAHVAHEHEKKVHIDAFKEEVERIDGLGLLEKSIFLKIIPIFLKALEDC